MPRFEKKRPTKRGSDSDSDSGPDDVAPAKKSKPAASENAGKSAMPF